MKKRFFIVLFIVAMMLVSTLSHAETMYVVGGKLNMRKEASFSSTIILYIPNGTAVSTENGYTDGWQKITSWGYLSGQTPGLNVQRTGWVRAEFLAN